MRGHRALVTAPGQVELQWIDPPQPQAGQVLLRALNTLISPGTERAFFLNLENTDPELPVSAPATVSSARLSPSATMWRR